jgi:hypothetical protein
VVEAGGHELAAVGFRSDVRIGHDLPYLLCTPAGDGDLGSPGHLAEWREDREALAKFGTNLRQSFKTISVECGVGKLKAKILMNHKMDRDVHDGYTTTPELREHLHGCQARISAAIMGRLAPAMGPALLLAMDLAPAITSAKRARVARIKRMAPFLQHHS